MRLLKNKNFATEAQIRQAHCKRRHRESIEIFSKRLYKRLAYSHNPALTSNITLTSVTQCLGGISFYTIPNF